MLLMKGEIIDDDKAEVEKHQREQDHTRKKEEMQVETDNMKKAKLTLHGCNLVLSVWRQITKCCEKKSFTFKEMLNFASNNSVGVGQLSDNMPI